MCSSDLAPGTIAAAQRYLTEQGPRNRSPTPPKALFRSTTGKGVAFTEEDVAFLVKFLAYRRYVSCVRHQRRVGSFKLWSRAQGRLDMVMFWKDVAAKVGCLLYLVRVSEEI